MYRQNALRLALPARSVVSSTFRSPPARPLAQRKPISPLAFRTYADAAAPPPPPPSASGGGGGGGGNQMYIVLAAILALGGAGYWFLKPVRDVASVTHQAIGAVKGQGGDLSDALSGMAKSMLPPGAFALYSHLASQPGGINGLLTNLKDKDLQGVLDEVKKHGGDDVKRVVDIVEKRVKEAGGKVENVDWKAMAEELKKELPASAQKAVDLLIGQMPKKEDIQNMVKKFSDIGDEKKKQLEESAKKVLAQVKKAQKDGKGQADAFLKGLKDAAPADIDGLIKQLKDAAKSAGLPADTAEAWLKSKAEDGKVNAEEMAKQLQDKLRSAARFSPIEPKELVDQVKQFSPSIAELLAQALLQAGIVDEKLNKK